jgi:hypothetical protein
MAILEGTVSTPFGHLPKAGVIVVGGGTVIVLGVAWYRSRQAPAVTPATDASAADATDATDATDAGLDPYASGDAGLNTGGYYDAGGNYVPYDPYSAGNATPGVAGPGSFTSNAQWSQYVQQYLTGTEGLDAALVGHAIGNYLTGTPVDDTMIPVINQAISVGDRPPVAGPNGNPPGFIHAGTPTGTTTTSTTVKVPNVVGLNYGKAFNDIRNAGLQPSPDTGVNATWKITGQSPAAGTSASRNAIVRLTYVKHA